MYLQLEPGQYVVAVSGGVDSMALLHRLRQEPGLELIVAHLDHGMRPDSGEDQELVRRVAGEYGLLFVSERAELGKGASEARARMARYAFLHKVRRDSGARAIITGHHQDDVLETAILNLLRGTGRKGLTALSSRHDLRRPLLAVPKREVTDYAQFHHLEWREDSTNQDENYLRNYVRRQLLPRFDEPARAQFLALLAELRSINHATDTLLVNYLHKQTATGQLDRGQFIQLSHAEAREAMAAWLRAHQVQTFDSHALERLVVAMKVGRAGSTYDVTQGITVRVSRQYLALQGPER